MENAQEVTPAVTPMLRQRGDAGPLDQREKEKEGVSLVLQQPPGRKEVAECYANIGHKVGVPMATRAKQGIIITQRLQAHPVGVQHPTGAEGVHATVVVLAARAAGADL